MVIVHACPMIIVHAYTTIQIHACIMTIVHPCYMVLVHACTIIIVQAYTMIVVYTCIMIIVHASTMIILHACTMTIEHACTLIIVHASKMLRVYAYAMTMIVGFVSCPTGIVFREIGDGDHGDKPPQKRRGVRDSECPMICPDNKFVYRSCLSSQKQDFMLYISLSVQIKVGVSARNLLMRFTKRRYKRKLTLHNFRYSKVIINPPPDHVLGCFLYQSANKKPKSIIGIVIIVRKLLKRFKSSQLVVGRRQGAASNEKSSTQTKLLIPNVTLQSEHILRITNLMA